MKKSFFSIKSVGDVFGVLFWIGFWIFIGAYAIPHHHRPKLTKDESDAHRIKREEKYEAWYWEQQKKDQKSNKTVLAKIETPEGNIITGRLLFFVPCTKDVECAQPDGVNTDESTYPVETEDKSGDEQEPPDGI